MRYGSVLVLEASGEGSTPSILTKFMTLDYKWLYTQHLAQGQTHFESHQLSLV